MPRCFIVLFGAALLADFYGMAHGSSIILGMIPVAIVIVFSILLRLTDRKV